MTVLVVPASSPACLAEPIRAAPARDPVDNQGHSHIGIRKERAIRKLSLKWSLASCCENKNQLISSIPKMEHSQNSSNTLASWQKKQLLIDIEESGGLKAINFLDVCKLNPKFYGQSGGALRRSFQFYLNNLRRRDPKSYLQLLLSLDINPCAATLLAASEG